MSIKRKIAGGFIISYFILSIIFIFGLLPNYREESIEKFEESIKMDIIALDENLNYIKTSKINTQINFDAQKIFEDKMYIDQMRKIFSKIWSDQIGAFYLKYNDELINLKKGKIKLQKDRNEIEKNVLNNEINNEKLERINVNSQDYFILKMNSKNQNLEYYYILDIDIFHSHQFEMIEPIIYSIVGFITIFSIFILFFIHKIVIIPINSLNNTTKHILETGNLDSKVSIDCTDEIGQMAKSFNSMLDEVRKTRDNLELLVKERTEKLEKEKVRANKANKAKSDFLANMSHEIRTPINAVIGLTDLISKTNLNFKQKNYVDKVKHAANNLLNLINDILDFSKVEAGKMELERISFDLEEVIDNLSDILGIKASKQNVELVIKLNRDVPTNLIGDPSRLTQVLLNLLNNAIKFTENGEVLLEVQTLDNCQENTTLKFIVKDTGIGMNEKQLNNLFSEFSQADTSTTRKYGGTGLGLAITKNIVDLMDGTIDVKSSVGKGTVFTTVICFDKSSKTNDKESARIEKNDLDVLIVDDNIDARLTFEEYLRPFIKSIYSVESGKKALKAIKMNDYDLMILDYKMTNMSGLKLLDLIINDKSIKNLPNILLITAYGKELFNNTLDDYPIENILMKPVSSKKLISSINKIYFASEEINKFKDVGKENNKFKKQSILVAEDNEINQLIVVENLENRNFDVTVVDNGKKALEEFRNKSYDLILMDLQMPVMDGYQASQEILKIDNSIPIIALTADVFDGVVERVKSNGMVSYISKPIDFDKLFEIINKYLSSEKINNKKQSEFIELQYFNVKEGLERIGNNKEAYKNVLKKFQSQSPNLIKKCLKYLESKKYDLLKKELHKLKGLTGNLSFTKAYNLITLLEEKLNENSLMKKDLEKLKKIIMKANKEISILNFKNESIKLKNKEMDKFYQELSEKVKSYDIEAYEYLVENEKIFKENNKDVVFKNLLDVLSDYEYEKALKIINDNI